jgi:hypothetical protein
MSNDATRIYSTWRSGESNGYCDLSRLGRGGAVSGYRGESNWDDFLELAAGDLGMSEVCDDNLWCVRLDEDFWLAGNEENEVLLSTKEPLGREE